jgi:hypothetical protein
MDTKTRRNHVDHYNRFANALSARARSGRACLIACRVPSPPGSGLNLLQPTCAMPPDLHIER